VNGFQIEVESEKNTKVASPQPDICATDIDDAYNKCLLNLAENFVEKFGHPKSLVEKVKQIYL